VSVKACINKIKTPGAAEKFDNLVKSGMDEHLAAREVVIDEHKLLHGRLNSLKSALSIPVSDYVAPELSVDKISDIEKKAKESRDKIVSSVEEKKQAKAAKELEAKNKKEAEAKTAKEEKAAKEKKAKEEKDTVKVGDTFDKNGVSWTVTEVGENRVRVTNGSIQTSFPKETFEKKDADTVKEQPKAETPQNETTQASSTRVEEGRGGVVDIEAPKLKTRFTKEQISKVQQNTGVSEKAAVEILHIMETEKSHDAAREKVAAIIKNDQRTSINAPLKKGQPLTDEELRSETPDSEIIDATKDFEGEERQAMAASANTYFEKALNDLRADGRVQFDSATDRLEGGEDGLFYVITGDRNGRDRGVASAILAAHRLINDNNSPLVSLFSRVGKKIRIIYSNTFNIYDKKGNFVKAAKSLKEAREFAADKGYKIVHPPILAADDSDSSIIINAYMLNERLEEFGGEKRFFNWLEMALYEEAIHLAQYQVATDIEMNQVAKEMSTEEKELVADQYGVKVADLTNFQMASEYVRQLVQHDLFGTTTELLKPKTVARMYLSKLLKKLVEFFAGKKDKISDIIVRRIENTIRGVKDNTLPKIESVEKQVSEKPKAGVLEYGPSPVYKVSYKNYQFAIKQLDTDSGPAFFEVEKVKGKWQAVKLLGYSPSEAMVALKLRVDEDRVNRTSSVNDSTDNLRVDLKTAVVSELRSEFDELNLTRQKGERRIENIRLNYLFIKSVGDNTYYSFDEFVSGLNKEVEPNFVSSGKKEKLKEWYNKVIIELKKVDDVIEAIYGESDNTYLTEAQTGMLKNLLSLDIFSKTPKDRTRHEQMMGIGEDVYLLKKYLGIGESETGGNVLNTSQSYSDDWFGDMYQEFHGKEERNGADPIADYNIKNSGKLILSQIAFTHAKRANDKNFDASEYMIESRAMAQAEWDIGNIVADVFLKYDFESAFQYFVDKISDNSIEYEVRRILARKMIEKFESRPDIVHFLRIKLDRPLGSQAGSQLVSGKDFKTREKGNPENNKEQSPIVNRVVDTKGMWGKDLSEAQENGITGAVASGELIVNTKVELAKINEDNSVSEEVEQMLGIMLDQSDERIKELEDEVKQLREKATKGINDQITETLGIMLDQSSDSVAKLKKELSDSSKENAELEKEVAELHKKIKELNKKNVTKEVEETLGIMLDQANEKIAKLEKSKKNEKILASLLKQANEKIAQLESRIANVGKIAKVSNFEKEMAVAKSKAAMNRMRKFNTGEKSDKKIIEDLKEKINKIAKLCSV